MKLSRIAGRGAVAVSKSNCASGSGYFSLVVALAATDNSHDKL